MASPGLAVHFGAGALGRGLVLPRLVDAGWLVTLIDADRALVTALSKAGNYPLLTADGEARAIVDLPVAGAFHPSDAEAGARLSAARLVTTAVRRENLGRVAAALVKAWNRDGMPETVTVVGCENVERVDEILDAVFAEAGISAEQRAGLVLPRTVVDRICAADWPSSLVVTVDPSNELSVGAPVTVPGMETVTEIDARFARKRYLVNTLADASALLGVARGHRTLAEAISDAAIQREIEPLLASLRLHLELAYGFDGEGLDAYLAHSRRRLANVAIPRRIETVARDFWRKLGPSERFAEPLIYLESRGRLDQTAVAVVGALVRTTAPGKSVGHEIAASRADLSPAARRFYDRVEETLS